MDLELKEIVVTLYKHEDLESFYEDMSASGKNGKQWIPDRPVTRTCKRPISRNTHYLLTETEAYHLKNDPRVWETALVSTFAVRRQSGFINNEPYAVSGNFWKDDTQGPATVSPTDRQWGHIQCAGDVGQRRKGVFGPINQGGTVEQVNDTVEVFSSGRHVDVVIVDDAIAHDCEEWYSPTSNTTRFVQYQWFNELNSLVNSIDDDGQVEPSGNITYHTMATLPASDFHGVHVCGTACGQYYGWARESNIYNIAVTSTWQSGQSVGALLIYDYLRAFHRSKAINPTTGIKNPTITNHSYGGIYDYEQPFDFVDLTNVNFRGVNYNSNNPGPSGWTQAGVEQDFGVRFGGQYLPAYSAAIAADVQDAIDDGVVIVGAAGNDNLLMAAQNDQDWNNTITLANFGTIFYNRGAWPNTPDIDVISVGALNKHQDFRRSTYTNFGPGVTVFAPGDNILSSYSSAGLNDTKYTQGTGNYFYPIQGTSMASPQVCGILACLATNKRFDQNTAIGYVNKLSVYNDMTFDAFGGALNDNTCQFGSPNKYIAIENPRQSIGYNTEVKGERTTGQTFPRPNVYHQS